LNDPNAIPTLITQTGELISPGPGDIWNIGQNAGVSITAVGAPDPTLTEQMLDHVFSLLLAGTTPIQTALEVGLTELDTVERMLIPIEAVRTAARAFCVRVMAYANLTSTMTTDRTLTRIPDGETESFDAAKLKGLITDMVGNGGRDAEIAGLIAQCRKKGHRAGYLMIKARKGE
jgi:hypothetical protein